MDRVDIIEVKEQRTYTLVIASIGWVLLLTVTMLASVWAVNSRFDTIVDRMDHKFEMVDNRLDRLEARMDSLETRMDSLEARMDSLETRMESIETQLQLVLSSLAALTDASRASSEYPVIKRLQ